MRRKGTILFLLLDLGVPRPLLSLLRALRFTALPTMILHLESAWLIKSGDSLVAKAFCGAGSVSFMIWAIPLLLMLSECHIRISYASRLSPTFSFRLMPQRLRCRL